MVRSGIYLLSISSRCLLAAGESTRPRSDDRTVLTHASDLDLSSPHNHFFAPAPIIIEPTVALQRRWCSYEHGHGQWPTAQRAWTWMDDADCHGTPSRPRAGKDSAQGEGGEDGRRDEREDVSCCISDHSKARVHEAASAGTYSDPEANLSGIGSA
ncbi:hypothetical protein EXIGLDRAFT_48218 [Exidia glandulosa HHB12029]|uniref:Secreted protein n=1 Tax=Exidia glandulosa HHB12029 TaxID=1314781 RepID=A0A165P6L6_EXIGL|nr:hypothetical protein EXIGLDRAFT_48218 [Exidia glandulosa HHB12029]